MVWCGVVWCGVVWCGVVWCGVVWCGVVWCGVVWCGVVWCGVSKRTVAYSAACSRDNWGQQIKEEILGTMYCYIVSAAVEIYYC